jgi:Arc/MetJ family transcription regulator
VNRQAMDLKPEPEHHAGSGLHSHPMLRILNPTQTRWNPSSSMPTHTLFNESIRIDPSDAYILYCRCIYPVLILCIEVINMRTTLDIPESLMDEAMMLTRIKTKTELIKVALQNLIQKEKVRDLKNYYGKINLDIDLDTLRDR